MKKIQVPHTAALIFGIVALMAVATWILPAGEFMRVENADGRVIVVDGSYHTVEASPQGLGAILLSPIKGIVEAVEIIGFILLIGGAFKIIFLTGAIDAAIFRVVRLLGKREFLVIPIMMTLFSAGGAVFGMAEETLPFIMVFVPFALAVGYDSIVGLSIPLVGAYLGFAAAMFNPFTVGIAQGIAQIPLFSGVGFRTVSWFVVTVVGIGFVMRYAARVKKNPKLSPVYEMDLKKKVTLKSEDTGETTFTTVHKLVLIVFGLGFATLIFGVLKWEWYIEEICAVFVAIGLGVGIVARMGPSRIAEAFIDGAKDLCGAALLVGVARGILVVASEGKIIDTILYDLASVISSVHPVVSAWLMFGVQTCINFFIPSGSGQAAVTIPIMAPLGDLVGLTRQVVVLAYQYGDGFTNLIIPTNVVLVGGLLVADIPWSKWARWILPLQGIFVLLGCAFLAVAVLTGYGP